MTRMSRSVVTPDIDVKHKIPDIPLRPAGYQQSVTRPSAAAATVCGVISGNR